ncbi:Hypothetical protein FKW44_012513, partial [Caligus rogercresseyi]
IGKSNGSICCRLCKEEEERPCHLIYDSVRVVKERNQISEESKSRRTPIEINI